ncbi:MAG: choice-of-anchor D domain-containing protein [Muribaculaceae bacterium]|nr:choice-of-anchor D domain-containing protein [Muribaculaceae bacterium]
MKKYLLFLFLALGAVQGCYASFRVSPGSLTFSNQIVGKTSTQTFTVEHDNRSDIKSVEIAGDDKNMFIVKKVDDQEMSYYIEGFYQYYWIATYEVTYQPTAAGSHSAKVTITKDGLLWDKTKTVTLSGTAVVPSVSTNGVSSMSFINKTVGKTYTASFRLTGYNLTGGLTLKLAGATGAFSINKTSISKSDAESGSSSVVVTYKPTAAGTHNATITISGGGLLAPKTISLTGNAVNRTITTNVSSLSFGTIAKGKSSTKSFTVKGTNLTGPLYLTPSGATGMYTITPSTITAAQAASGVTVTVTYKPTATGTHNATITISGGDALASKTVSLTGACGTPVIKTSKSTIIFSESGSNSFVVTGTNLTGNLTLTLSGSNIFTISKTTITAAQAANGVTVGVLCNPTKNMQRATAKITISGGGASSKTVNLSYSQNQVAQINTVEPEDDNDECHEEFTNGGSLEIFENSTTDVKELAEDLRIYAEGQSIVIESEVEQSAVICDISGRVRSVNLQVGRNEIPVNARGIYIVRIRENVTKLMLK